jgi:tryptophanyl-tRNA synthetase
VDQVPHIEISREIARRFNKTYREIFPEPQPLLTEIPKIPGTDGRKMSKSYGNAVILSEPPADIDTKLSRMATDPRRVRRHDPGEPADCPAFNLHRLYCTPEEIEFVSHGCRTAEIGCLDCKKVMIRHVLEDLAKFREKRTYWEQHRDNVRDVLVEGGRQARDPFEPTMPIWSPRLTCSGASPWSGVGRRHSPKSAFQNSLTGHYRTRRLTGEGRRGPAGEQSA